MKTDPDHDPGKPGKPLAAMEVSALLKLVVTLGLTLTAGIVIFFLIGLWLERRYELNGIGVIAGVVVGLAISIYWAYLRIREHMKQFAPEALEPRPDKPPVNAGAASGWDDDNEDEDRDF